MVRAVLFDLDDTLFDHQHCSREALGGVRALHPCFEQIEAQSLEAAHARILEELHADVMVGKVPLDVARAERFRRLYEFAGLEAEQEQVVRTAAAYRDAYIAARRAIAGATGLLAAVRQRASVGVVSNNLLAEQQQKMRDCGLDRHCDVLVVSEEAGVSKPDPRIFEIALERLQCRAEEAVMVGDSWSADVEGARAAGIRPIWFNRNGLPAPAAGVDEITSLEPAADVLLKIFLEEPRATT